MTHLEQAIRDAESTGYEAAHEYNCQYCDDAFGEPPLCIEKTLFDPAFWQALGKARGWSTDEQVRMKYYGKVVAENCHIQEWQFYWHRFIDHLASEYQKDPEHYSCSAAESFFATL